MRKIILIIAMLFCIGTAEAASFTITIPDEILTEVVDAFAAKFHYQEEVPNPEYNPEDPESLRVIPNPVSKTGFAKSRLKRIVRDIFLEQKLREGKAILYGEIDAINEVTSGIIVE